MKPIPFTPFSFANASHPFADAQQYVTFCQHKQGRVAEPAPTLDPFTERHLHCIWYDDRLRPTSLKTERGEDLQILYPGKWNQESGPDFLDAEWIVGGRRRRGDVEIHIRPMDWKHHGHRGDPNYQHVGLHVTYEPGELPEGLLPLGCEEVSLRSLLDQRSHFFFDQIDLRAYPWQTESGRSGLRAFFEDKSEEDCGRMLEAAGQERLRRKSLRMARVIQAVGEDQALYTALLRGLGYKQNAGVCENLARVMPLSVLQSYAFGKTEQAFALLLGVAGLLPSDMDEGCLPSWMPLRDLWDKWWPHQHHFMDKSLDLQDWRLDHLRPGNHPIRRLRAMAHWVSMEVQFTELFCPSAEDNDRTWLRRTLSRLQVPSPNPLADPDHLVGSLRAGTLLLNAVLPWRICCAPESITDSLWQHLPDEAFNSKTKQAATVLFGPDQHPRLYRGGLRKQGLLQFHEDFQL
jgi:hypothetical protein